MRMDERVIIVDKLSKRYRVGRPQSSHNTLRDALTGAARRWAQALQRPRGSGEDQPGFHWALRDVSFEVRRGDVAGVIGRNGAGKSTLLKILSRITEPTKGRVVIRGRVGSLLEVGTGFHPELTGRENVFLNGAILGMKKNEIARSFDSIVAFAEVEKFIDTPVKWYSNGMYLRLAFAVAAHLEPEILIIDEVLAVGDLQFQKKCLGKMGEVAKSGRTVLFVSHNMGAVARMCNTCLLLDGGKVVAFGRAHDVIATYQATYGSACPEWTRDPKRTPESAVTLLRARVLDGCAPRGTFRGHEPITVEIEYQVREPVADCAISARVYSGDGAVVMSTSDPDPAGAPALPRRPGRFRGAFVIPAHMLAPGNYSVFIAAHSPNRQMYDAVENAVSFEVSAAGSLAAMDGRLGYFAPLLKWVTTPCDAG